MSNKKILVEYLYLDLKTCDRCIGTDNVLVSFLPYDPCEWAGHL